MDNVLRVPINSPVFDTSEEASRWLQEVGDVMTHLNLPHSLKVGSYVTGWVEKPNHREIHPAAEAFAIKQMAEWFIPLRGPTQQMFLDYCEFRANHAERAEETQAWDNLAKEITGEAG